MKQDSQVTRRDLMEKAVVMGSMAAAIGASQAAQAADGEQGKAAGGAAVNRKSGGVESDYLLVISGVIPRLGVSAGLKGPRSESGIGALMPWAGRLWFITYTSHTSTAGSGYASSSRLKQSQVIGRSRLRRDSQYRQIRWTCMRKVDNDELLPVIP